MLVCDIFEDGVRDYSRQPAKESTAATGGIKYKHDPRGDVAYWRHGCAYFPHAMIKMLKNVIFRVAPAPSKLLGQPKDSHAIVIVGLAANCGAPHCRKNLKLIFNVNAV